MDEIEKFKEATTPFLPIWKVLEVKAVADLDTMTLLSMVSCFSPDDPKPLEVTDPIQGIIFIREAKPVSELYRILDGLEQGTILLGQYQLAASEFSTFRFNDLGSTPSEDLALGWPDFKTYRQFFLGSQSHKDWDVLTGGKDTSAVARVWGFNSFKEMALHRVQFRAGGGYVNRLEIFAPVFAGIEAKAKANKLHLKIQIHEALQIDDLSLSYRVQDVGGHRLAGDQIPITEFHKSASGYFSVLQSSMVIPDGARSGEVSVNYRKHRHPLEPIAHTLFSVEPLPGVANQRWNLVLSVVDNTRKWVKQGVSPEDVIKQWLGLSQNRPEAKDFERGVAILLFSAGLYAMPLGEAEGVDTVLFRDMPDSAAMVISCTTSSDIGKKVSDLLLQQNSIKDKLPRFSVHAAIFCPVEQRDLRLGDIEDSKARGIKLFLRPDIQALFDKVRGVDWREAGDYFVECFFQT